jgi:3-oxoacyl-[acyl-carrier protein] reductase
MGIGRAISERLAEHGAAVAIMDVNREQVQITVDGIREKGGQATAIVGDVASEEDTKSAVEQAVRNFKGLHILVNNAGISPTTREPEKMSLSEWNRVLAINLTGPFLMIRAALPYLKQAGSKGRVINMGSLAGQVGGIAVGLHYTASKGGIMAITKQLAKILAPFRATANNIAPGTTNTTLVQEWTEETKKSLIAMIPLGRLGEPKDVADVALFLASDASAFITGTTINVNGGMFIS